ncbi:MAG: membrane protein insertion efficiency factor YidD [Deltaproteobacteria bacterium]|nr:membrane protein insertion efficiency factor YidD [Deltaproteobacteria bacterium]
MVAQLLDKLIALYQRLLSPLLPPACRFHPSCSHYAREAISVHGAAKGSLLAAWRILRCQPFCRGGLDPVPPRRALGAGHRNEAHP